MAVNVSTITSICLYCKTSEENSEKEFHEIYDEVGVELQLPKLVETLFKIKVDNTNKQTLCEDCLNRLIELFDLEEHAKERKGKPGNTTKLLIPGNSIVELESNSKEYDNDECEKKYTEYKEDSESLQNNFQLIEDHLDHDIDTIIESEFINADKTDEKSDTRCLEFTEEDVQNKLYLLKNHPHHNKIPQITQSKTIQNKDKNKFGYKKQEIKFLDKNIECGGEEIKPELDIEGIVENYNEEVLEYVENSEFVEEAENSLDTTTHVEHFELDENHFDLIVDDENFSIDTIETIDTLQSSEQTNYIEVDKEVIEAENEEIVLEVNEDVIEEINEELNDVDQHVHEELCEDFLDSNTNDTQNEEIEELILDEEINEQESVNYNVKEFTSTDDTKNKISNKKSIESKRRIKKTPHNLENDTYSIKEEHLIEEINCTQEYDNIDINEYLDKAIVTNFKDLQLDWKVDCKLCLDKYETFQELLHHECITDAEQEEREYSCIIKGCKEHLGNFKNLARHLILRHYNKLESISIYGKCPDCQKTFSNFIEFNKHSCCRTIKKRTGLPNYCQSCDMDFQSLKRYVFHMQYHFTNHRPKVCLLCGDLFNNSNDFFEHTQYKHSPDSSMACIKCDRFFKEKNVFDKHMELHNALKYQFACSYCPKIYTNKNSLNQHMDIYHNNKSKAMICEFCEKEFVNGTSYRNHMKSHASEVEIYSYICSACGFITNNVDCIKDHTESNKDSTCYASVTEEEVLGFGYTCENCSIDFRTIKQLKQHRLTDNHKDDLYYCGVCRRSFKSLRQMRNHSTNHKELLKWEEAFPITRYFVCNIGDCREFYTIWTTLYYHKKRPHNTAENSDLPKEFKCQFCQQICSSKMSLAVHVARSHNNSNISCTHCKQTYKSQKLLQQHIDKFHTPVKCEICLKDFKHRRNLQSHKDLVHRNIKRYFCQYCDKGYFYNSEKEAHEKKVHPKVSYKCELCDFTTNYSQSLEVHMDIHNSQQKFQCSVCSKTFGRKQLLQIHLKRHQNKKEYICSDYVTDIGCDSAFYTYHELKIHIKNKHPNSKYMKDNKRKKTTIQIDDENDDSYDISFSDADNVPSKRLKTVPTLSVNDDGYVEDDDVGSPDYIIENDMELNEQQQSENEFEIICG